MKKLITALLLLLIATTCFLGCSNNKTFSIGQPQEHNGIRFTPTQLETEGAGTKGFSLSINYICKITLMVENTNKFEIVLFPTKWQLERTESDFECNLSSNSRNSKEMGFNSVYSQQVREYELWFEVPKWFEFKESEFLLKYEFNNYNEKDYLVWKIK